MRVHAHTCKYMYHDMHVAVRGQLARVGVLYYVGPKDQTQATRLVLWPHAGPFSDIFMI